MNSLVDAAGNVRFGIFPEPIDELNHRRFVPTNPFGKPLGPLRRHFAFNQFEFLGAVSDTLVFGCAIANVKFAGTVFAYAYEPPTKRFREFSFARPLGRGIRFDQMPECGTSEFRAGENLVQLSGSEHPRQRRLVVKIAAGLVIDATFDEENPPQEPMRICTPVTSTGWVYARKTAGHRVSGKLQVGYDTFDLAAIGARGHHDWSAGYMRRQTFWNWGCLAGQLNDGRVVGLNVSCGVNETSFTENCFWLDGRLQKVDTVRFEYDRRDVMKPWQMTSFDGRVDLRFRPEARHEEHINALIVASDFNQLIGRYDGTLTTATGDVLRINNMLGYAEHHYAKW